MKVPSVAFLTSLCIKDIEQCVPYYKCKLEMVSGKALSGDHSHKIAKVILIEGKEGFQGLYTLMNEFGKILHFWLVNGTNLREVEEQLRGIKWHYRQHGFEGLFILTVDNSLQTKSFFAVSNNTKRSLSFLLMFPNDKITWMSPMAAPSPLVIWMATVTKMVAAQALLAVAQLEVAVTQLMLWPIKYTAATVFC